MAEHTNEEKKMFANSFASVYNNENGTNYRWEDEKSLTPEEPYDFKLFDEGRVLGVQMVRGVVADTDKVYARPGYATKVVDLLRTILQTKEMLSVCIFLNFPKPPKKREQIEQLAHHLAEVIYTCCLGELPYLANEENFDEPFLSTMKDYVSEIHIELRTDGETGFQVSFGWSSGKLEGAFDSKQKILGAEKRKRGKYDHVILLVDPVNWPVEDYEISSIKNALVGSPIKEIWIVNNFVGNQRAIRVK